MLIRALCDYYDVLAKNGKVDNGFSKVPIHCCIMLSPDGKITSLVDIQKEISYFDKKGKKKIKSSPQVLKFPLREDSSSIMSYRIDHRSKYIFGFFYDKKSEKFILNNDAAHSKFVERNLEFIDGIDEPIVNAFRNFLITFKPEEELNNPILLEKAREINSWSFCFALDGFKDVHLNQSNGVIKKVQTESMSSESGKNPELLSTCAITGKKDIIAQKHFKIKGLQGDMMSGYKLVSANENSCESYQKEDGFISNISEKAMYKYTEAFNYLTSHKDSNTQKFTNKIDINSMTVIFFAADKSSDEEDTIMRWLLECDDKIDSEKLQKQFESLMDHITNGNALDINRIITDSSADYYVAGFVTNSSRVCMKFCYRDAFGNILENIIRHQRDISMGKSDKPVTISQLTAELVSPVSKEQASPPIISALMDSIFLGRRYPDSLLAAVINRVKTDNDTETNPYIKINPRRIGLIKACLNRNYKEEFTVALDETRKDKAYLCGRLFAVLEKIQQAAQGTELNTTIKDSYFAAACSKPAVVLPRLIMLAQNHLKKLDSDYYNYCMGEILNLLEGNFPSALSIEEQGAFIIGYYQQFFKKAKSNKESE